MIKTWVNKLWGPSPLVNAIKIVCIGVIAGLSMGNQGCQQQQTTLNQPQGRFLAKFAQLGPIRSFNLEVPGSGSFDLQSVMNWQTTSLLAQSNRFVVQIPDNVLAAQANVARADAAAIRIHLRQAAPGRPEDQTLPACLQGLPQVILTGQVNSFEATSGGGLSLGFSGAGSFGASASFNVANAQMDMGMMAVDPYFHEIQGVGEATATETKTSIGLNINFAMFSINPSYWFQTPLAQVSQTAITLSLNSLFANIDQKAAANPAIPVWESTVEQGTQTDSKMILIRGGTINGIMAGDQFDIFNVHTDWQGAPCQSKLLDRVPSTSQPIATVQISSAPGDLGQDYAFAQIISSNGDPIYPGAIVRIHQLVQPTPPPSNSSNTSNNQPVTNVSSGS